MKRALVISAVVCSMAGAAVAADVLSELGIAPQEAKEAVSEILGAGLMNPGVGGAAFKAEAPAARASIATAAVAWLKGYAATPEFKQAYLTMRDNRKPQPPEFKGTPEDELKASAPQDPMKNPDTQKMLATLPPDQRKQVEDSLKQMAAMIAQQNTPEAQKQRLQMIKADRANRAQTYQNELAKWQKDYPDDPKPLVVRRLHEFLDLSATVDFNAQTTGANHKGTFVNPAYEQKPDQWKLCFRAGKDATTAARTAVQAWLKELGA
jgi:hypothetical protein